MSLYNQLLGVNPLAGPLMSLLKLGTSDVGRFRDCYPRRTDNGEIRIVIFTRNGGGNRDDHLAVFERLRAHPQYLRDWDDDFDSTYASIEFLVPVQFAEMVRRMVLIVETNAPETLEPPMVRFKALIDKLKASDGQSDDPDVVHAREVGERLLAPLFEHLGRRPPRPGEEDTEQPPLHRKDPPG